MKRTDEMEPKNKFGRWLLDSMIDSGMTCGYVAKQLGTTRQCVRNHIVGETEPSFVWVVAYCWLFDELDNLTRIWYLTMEKES